MVGFSLSLSYFFAGDRFTVSNFPSSSLNGKSVVVDIIYVFPAENEIYIYKRKKIKLKKCKPQMLEIYVTDVRQI